MKDTLNNRVKHRDPWRPFAPSMLEEDKERYLVNAHTSPYMILSFDVVKENGHEISATVHVDNSTRPQTVSPDYNARYYELISKFKKLTGISAILNTSFNVKGEPIVCSPADATRAFFSTGMDYLILGDFILKKE
jgi:carbamoyltransferase